MPPENEPAPRRPVLIFDGDCGLCTRSAGWVRSVIDRRQRMTIRPWQRTDLAALGVTAQQCQSSVQFVDGDGRRFERAAAIAAVLRAGSLPWRPLGRLLALPPVTWIADRVYDVIARNRYRLPGGTPACAVPQQPAGRSGLEAALSEGSDGGRRSPSSR